MTALPDLVKPAVVVHDGLALSATATRMMHSVVEVDFQETRQDYHEMLAARESLVLRPKKTRKTKPSQDLLRISSWNVQHLAGGCDAISQRLRRTRADVIFVQGVSRCEAERLVNGLGYVGYFSRMLADEGQLTLIHPQLRVRENRRHILNGDYQPGDLGGAVEALRRYESSYDPITREFLTPRTMQLIRIQGPLGTIQLFHAHLSQGKDFKTHKGINLGTLRREQARLAADLMERFVPGGIPVVGCFYNAMATGTVVEQLAQHDMTLLGGGARTRLASWDMGAAWVRCTRQKDFGLPLSKFPLVRAEIDVN